MDNSIMTDGIYSKISGSYINRSKVEEETDATNSYMSFDGYLKLLVAQMQNQDFNNPMDDSEVLAQMAQYSMLEGIKNMTQQSSVSYASSLVGKVVTVDDGNGAYTGMVESVTVKKGEPYLIVDGMEYKSDKVTDIVQEGIYNLMITLIGQKVRSKNSESENAVTGVVSNVVYLAGEAYVVVNDKLYSLDDIVIATDEGSEGTGDTEGSEGSEGGTEGVEGAAGSENVSGTEGQEGTEKDSGADDSGEITVETAEAETSAAMSYKARSESLIDTFMKELDEAGGVSEVTETSAASAASSVNVTEEYYVEIMEVEVPDYSAGVYADSNVITGTVSSNSDAVMGSGSGTLSRSYDSETINNSYSYDNYNFSSGSGLKGVTTEKGVSTRDCVPHRISVEAYPEEAALADRLGTRMYDIRFINNRAITSRIKTDEVIGHSSSGKPVTEIGYSGVGQLGEVVTFADGTQRVEILMRNGNSGWLTTSGRLTLDEICTRNGAPGSLAGKLTPEESAIRHFSDPMANVDQSLRNSFQNYVSRNAV